MQGLFFLIFVVGLRYDASGLTGEVYDGAFLIQPPITTRYVIRMTDRHEERQHAEKFPLHFGCLSAYALTAFLLYYFSR